MQCHLSTSVTIRLQLRVLFCCAAMAAPLHRSYVLWNHFLPKEGPFASCRPLYPVLDIWTVSTEHCQFIKWTGNRKEKEEVEENSLFTGGILTHDLLNTRRGLYRCQNTWSINFFTHSELIDPVSCQAALLDIHFFLSHHKVRDAPPWGTWLRTLC